MTGQRKNAFCPEPALRAKDNAQFNEAFSLPRAMDLTAVAEVDTPGLAKEFDAENNSLETTLDYEPFPTP